jgi:hypothetical protein
MKHRLANVAALLVLAAMSVGYGLAQNADPVPPDEKPKKKKGAGKGKAGPKAQRDHAAPAFASDIDALRADLELTEQQVTKILGIREKRDAAMAKWDETQEKRKAQIEEKLPGLMGKENTRLREQAEAYLKALPLARARASAPYDKKMFVVLTPAQRGKWNSPVLRDAAIKEFSSPVLSGDQDVKLAAVCEKLGKTQSTPVSAVTHPSLMASLYKEVYLKVLDKYQQKSYKDVKMEEMKRKKEEEAKKKAAEKKKKKKK